ncbi:MAG: PDZ domain-containing protein [Acidobacteriia bacterium]|nr:PDZ domain-containing protein [Terriglobia bacterium]
MLRKGKIVVFVCSALVVLYCISAAFYEKVSAGNEAYPALNVFMDALARIDSDYVEAPDMNKVQEGAMRGLIEALDPYSTFLTADQVRGLDSRKDKTADVGVVLSKRANIICVVATARNGPAAAAGMRAGDYLVSIDGINVEDKSIIEAESLLRGAAGSKVKATVFRGSQTKPTELEMVRKNEEPVAVGSRMLDGHIGVLEIPSLSAPVLEQARIKLKTLISAGAQKLLLDLRDCANGEPVNGAELANFFLKSGGIYTSKTRGGETVLDVKAAPEKFITDLPMVALINGSTAGPAEIAAGALQGNGRAFVVGEKSFGIGSLQKRIELKSGAMLILSTAKFYTPDGKMIENDETLRDTGIKPDVESPDEDRLQSLLVDAYFDAQDDAAKYRQLEDKVSQEQFDKALEVLKKGVVPLKRAA